MEELGILVRRGHGEGRLRPDWEKSHGSIGNSCEKRSWGEEIEAGLGKEPWKYWKYL
jgi:hypothetical protein